MFNLKVYFTNILIFNYYLYDLNFLLNYNNFNYLTFLFKI